MEPSTLEAMVEQLISDHEDIRGVSLPPIEDSWYANMIRL